MKKNNLFYQYYDSLYAEKDYSGEVKTLLSIAKKYRNAEIKNILEIGCGTGNHTVEFAKTKNKITAVDTDVYMADIAKSKTQNLKNVNIHFGTIEKLNEKGFDVGFAMFNVITYIPDLKSLLSFFNGVSAAVKNNGIFIFDCWNGIAAIKDPPKSKTFHQNVDDKKITCELESKTDFQNQKVKLSYTIHLKDKKGKALGKDSFSFDQTLWTPMEIKHALETTNFEITECCKNFQPGKPASEADWKIMFICKRK